LRTLKALWITLFEPGKVQGASTITQQLAKNLFFSFERTYVRKFRELLVALQIEAQFSKQEILEAYINQIPFGVGAYGIGEAARTFFGKSAGELTLAEASLLAGLPKSPTRYNPFRYPERARARQQVVLQRMVDHRHDQPCGGR
jgi:membrane peptidoglycan carboxypeptidase